LIATSKTATRRGKPARRRETREQTGKRARRVIALLKKEYPEAHTALDHEDPFQLLVATILSAQCTDVRVNMVTPALFRSFPDAHALALAPTEKLEELIRSTGFFRNKAKNLKGCARGLVDRHEGRVPDTMEELTALDGVGRKTANVVLGNAFGKEVGIVVDTHVNRLANLLGLTSSSNPEKIEQDLMAVIPKKEWTLFAHLLIYHGRAICIARRPKCGACTLYDYCPGRREEKTTAGARKSKR